MKNIYCNNPFYFHKKFKVKYAINCFFFFFFFFTVYNSNSKIGPNIKLRNKGRRLFYLIGLNLFS
jgi:hypothetical protein